MAFKDNCDNTISDNQPKKRKHITLTIQEKLAIIDLIENGKHSRQAIATKFGIGKSTVHDIHKRREKVRDFAAIHNNEITKRRRVDQSMKTSNAVFKIEEPEEEETIDPTDSSFEFQVNEQDYEIVYEADLPEVDEVEPEEKEMKFEIPKAKRKSKTLTFKQKYDVIGAVESGSPVSEICERYGIGRTTVYDYMKRKEEIIDFINKSNDVDRRTFKKSKFPEVEERVLEWCDTKETFTKQQFYENAKISFDAARDNSSVANPSGFCGSWPWSKRFFNRHPTLKRKLVDAEGKPIDPCELSLSNVEYLEENFKDENSRDPQVVIGVESVKASQFLNLSAVDVPERKVTKFLTLCEKLQVLVDIDSGMSVPDIAAKYDVSRTTVYEIFRRRVELRELNVNKFNSSRKVNRASRYPELEFELLRWCLQQSDFPLSNMLIAEQALCLFEHLNLKGKFYPSYAWVKKFIIRNPELTEKQGLLMDEDVAEYEVNNDEAYVHDLEEDETMHHDQFELLEAVEMSEPEGYHEEEEEEEEEAEHDDIEYIVEELDPQDEEEEEPEFPPGLKDEPAKTIQVTDDIALKSLKILIKYSESRGHDTALMHLLEYRNQLRQNFS